MTEYFSDIDLGHVVVIRSAKAKRIIVRREEDHIRLTAPVNISINEIKKSFLILKPRILKLKAKTKLFFCEETQLQTITFSLSITKHNNQNYYMRLKNGLLSIACPSDCDFKDQNTQDIIRTMIEKALRYEAKKLLPFRTKALAKRYGFDYSKVKITKSSTRWGSCSSTKNINLSYFCLFLPEHLIDYIILHELCHTKEMNHSKRFWQLLDSVTTFKAKILTKELKETKITW